jgi:hypothetical protein
MRIHLQFLSQPIDWIVKEMVHASPDLGVAFFSHLFKIPWWAVLCGTLFRRDEEGTIEDAAREGGRRLDRILFRS